jgi:transposase
MEHEHFIGCDAHKQYSVFVAIDEKGKFSPAWRASHDGEEIRQLLDSFPAGSRIAVEATGSCYWLIDEMRARGHQPVLAHPLEAKKRMGKTKKTDRLDARGLAMLMRNGTLPEVWIPPSEVRDQREPMRLRMVLSRMRTRLKNRTHGVLARFNIQIVASDVFGAGGREELEAQLKRLPEHTQVSVRQALRTLDFLDHEIEEAEKHLAGMLKPSEAARLLDTLPCVGPILSAVMALEIGDIGRFQTAGQLASYAAGADRAFQRRTYADGAGIAEREPAAEVGVRGGGECDCDASEAASRESYGEAVYASTGKEEPPEGSGSGGAALGGSGVWDSDEETDLPGTGESGPEKLEANCFVDARVNAACSCPNQ